MKEDPCGYDRRIDAIVQVMQAAIVPRETSRDQCTEDRRRPRCMPFHTDDCPYV